jgi:23S rRNA C2498 (ribose-2'-O)-methylase RlmM
MAKSQTSSEQASFPPPEGDWGCVKVMTAFGRFYIARDVNEMRRVATNGRIVFSRSEMAHLLPMLQALPPDARAETMRLMMSAREVFGEAARIERVTKRESVPVSQEPRPFARHLRGTKSRSPSSSPRPQSSGEQAELLST